MAVFLGIDAGTTNVKALLIDHEGEIISFASAPTKVLVSKAGMSEMDMDALWEIICKLTRELIKKNGADLKDIAGVGISGQGDGMWPITADGRPARNAILWNDTRSCSLTGLDEAGLEELLIRNSSTALYVGARPMILKWLKENEPECFANIHKVVHCKDWINYKLTGVIASDYSDYSTSGINIFTKRHVTEAYEFLDISEATSMLPELFGSTEIIGSISTTAANQTGLPFGVPVICGALDVVASAQGAGVVNVGDRGIILGTTLGNNVLQETEQVDISARIGSTLCGVLPNQFFRIAAALSGTSSIDWAKSILASDLSFSELAKRLKEVPIGSCGIMYHPYIKGERAPFKNPFAKAGFYGLSFEHTRFEMMRAAYEGMAFSIRDCQDTLPKTNGNTYLSGGGAVCGFTCQLIADVLGCEILRPNRKELAAQGVVDVLRRSLGYTSLSENAELADTFYPSRDNYDQYSEIYERFTTLRKQMEPHWIKWGLRIGEH